MGLSVGIVGLPNAGKSTLFNALTKAGAAVGNYPFTTIEPNTGIVPVNDPRLGELAELFSPPKVIPATVTFTDVAGLVRGASRGEGRGNQFLGHIRECDAIAQVVRAFEDDNITHVEGSVDPERDIDVIEIELILADMDTIKRRLDRAQRSSKLTKEKSEVEIETLQQLHDHLNEGNPARTMSMAPDQRAAVHELWLLTMKPLLVIINVDEASANAPLAEQLAIRGRRSGGDALTISARIESEVAELEPADQREFLTSLGLEAPGLDRLAAEAYRLLDLITFFTAGEKEVRAWTLHNGGTAVDAAGAIHTDFARGFIRAEVVDCAALLEAGSYPAVREQGKQRLEGRDYLVRDGDVVHFRFNI